MNEYTECSEYLAASYENNQATRDAYEMVADRDHTDPLWQVLAWANHYSHASFKAMEAVK